MHYISKVWHALLNHKFITIGICAVLVILIAAPMAFDFISTRGHRYDLERTSISRVPFHKVAIVFGAGILPDGQPTPYLQHRIETAVTLYKAHRVDILLMSGDNSVTYHNEPLVMQEYAVKLGVPAKAIVVDDAGFDTYDTCYRASRLFGVHDATLVSQGYHLPRAMVTCRGLGIQNIGVIAVHPARDFTLSYLAREVLSSDKMVLQLMIKPRPAILGAPLPL